MTLSIIVYYVFFLTRLWYIIILPVYKHNERYKFLPIYDHTIIQ